MQVMTSVLLVEVRCQKTVAPLILEQVAYIMNFVIWQTLKQQLSVYISLVHLSSYPYHNSQSWMYMNELIFRPYLIFVYLLFAIININIRHQQLQCFEDAQPCCFFNGFLPIKYSTKMFSPFFISYYSGFSTFL